MFDNEMTQLLCGLADAVDDLASSENGDKLAAGMAILTKKLFSQLRYQGFTRDEAIKLTCASLGKGK